MPAQIELRTWLTDRLGIEFPIVGAPMGGRAGGALAAKVSAAGGIGMLGAARYNTPDWIAAEAAVAREGGKFGIGLMTWSLPENPAMLDAAIAAGPAMIALSFGNPAEYVAAVKDAGILTMSQVNTVEDLREAEAAGIELIVAQGGEAGGHTGRVATLPLLQEVLEATELPVLAAGGISTGRGLAAVLAAGGQGVLLGTVLLGSPETTGPEYARERVIAASATDTVYTDLFDRARNQPWPSRWFGRGIANEFTRRFAGSGASAEELREAYDTADPDVGVVYAGQATGMVRASLPADEVVRGVAAQARECLQLLAQKWA